MTSKIYALYGGVLMIMIGLLSLIPGMKGTVEGLPPLSVNLSYGLFLGILPINIFNKLALIVFGVAGVLVSNRPSGITSVRYCTIVFILMGALSILGKISSTSTLGGIWPLYGNEAVAHGLFAIVAGACALYDTKIDRVRV